MGSEAILLSMKKIASSLLSVASRNDTMFHVSKLNYRRHCILNSDTHDFIPLLSLLFILLTPSGLSAQDSILEQIIQSEASLVAIKSEMTGLYKSSKEGKAGINPKTGQVVAVSGITVASYQRFGAGVIIHPSGIIVTNSHIVAKASHLKVILHDNTEVPAEVIKVVNNLDFALLKITPPYPLSAIPMADSDQIELGEEIITVGNSELLRRTISGGKVIGLGTSRTLKDQGNNRTDLIQTTINLYQGDSGGPLFDKRGQLIGLMTAKEFSQDHSSFAIPSNKIKEYLLNYLQEASIPSP